jgi:NitT/TauT family transport system substrate-binding protein
MRHLRVMLEYFHPWTNAAGFYLARSEGWYAAEGIDVELIVPDPGRGDTLAHLVRGQVDFGVCPSNRLFVRCDQGEPALGVAAINHRGLETIQTLVSKGINRPRDLVGKRLALNPTPRGLAMVRHLVALDGGDPDGLIIVDSGVRELSPEALAEGEADASFGSYWAWDLLLPSRIPDTDRIIWPVDQIGAPPYHSYLLATRPALAESEPDLIRRFLRATSSGYQHVAADPSRALPLFERVIPYFPKSVLSRSLPLIAETWLDQGTWGRQREELLAPYAIWLAYHGIIEQSSIWQRATSNDYLDGAA